MSHGAEGLRGPARVYRVFCMQHTSIFAVACLLLAAAPARAQLNATVSRDSARLTGTVRDATGAPLADVEVFIAGAAQTVRTTGTGGFALAATPGNLDVWFRQIGSQTVRYLWVARLGEETHIVVTLQALPHTLDPVVVREREDKRFRGTATVRGVVVDSGGVPIEDAEVQVIGAHADGATRANGGFIFDRLPSGSLLLRVRKFGYAPNALSLQLDAGDDRELVIRLRRLPTTLDPVVVQAQSGYSAAEAAWDEFERRRRWRSAGDMVLGPADLQRYGSLPLDIATKYILNGVEELPKMRQQGRVTSFGHVHSRGAPPPAALNDVCILENGIHARYQPISVYSADDIEMLEVYPTNTELSGTVAARMDMVPRCRSDGLAHPTYYVVWLKGAR